MDLRLFGTLLIILALTNTAWSSPNDKLIVKADAPECQDKGEVLFCDYKSGNQKPVYLEKLDNPDVAKVFVYSALDLHISDDACVDVVIHNAKGATVIKSANNECNRKTSLSATKSEFKTLETRLGTISLDDCRVDKLILDSELFELTIKKTEIDVLDVSGHTGSGAKATIQDAKINTLARLIINHGSKWDIQRSEISKLKLQGLEIVDGTLTITDSSVQNTVEDSSMFENFHGSITLKGFPNQGSRTDSSTECNIFIGLFCLFFILLILSWISFIIYLNKKRIYKTPSLRLPAIRGANSKSKIQSNAKSENMHKSIDNSKLDDKVTYTNEQAETKTLLPEIKDKTEQKSRKLQQTREIKSDILQPSNIDIQKVNEHLQQLKNFLIALKTKFEESEKSFQNQKEKFATYEKGQSQTNSSDLKEQLKSSFAIVKEQFSKLDGLSKEEQEILKQLGTTQTFRNKPAHSYLHELFNETDDIFKKKTGTKRNIKEAEDMVNQHEIDLNNELTQLRSPVKKSELGMIAKIYEKAGHSKGLKYYCMPEELLDSILNIISDMEMACLKQFSMFILEIFMQVEKVYLLTLYINIALTKMLLRDAEHQ